MPRHDQDAGMNEMNQKLKQKSEIRNKKRRKQKQIAIGWYSDTRRPYPLLCCIISMPHAALSCGPKRGQVAGPRCRL